MPEVPQKCKECGWNRDNDLNGYRTDGYCFYWGYAIAFNPKLTSERCAETRFNIDEKKRTSV